MRQKLLIFLSSIFLISLPVHAQLFTLQTTSFKDQGALPKIYTCDGRDVSPELKWQDIPSGTKTFAILLSDLDAPGGIFYHWVVYNIPPSITSLSENITTLPKGSIIGKNSWGKTQYNGPCPPKGATHYYVFTVYAVDSSLTLPDKADGQTLLEALQKHTLSKSEVSATYGRSS